MTSSNRADVRDFLVTRRARINPQQAGLTFYGGNRRVPGLRREEAAMLAGVSVDYYTQIERGRLDGVSESVLDAIAGALRLDEAERAYFFDLARSANTRSRPRRPARDRVRPTLQHMLDAMTEAPALIRNARMDIIASNRLGRALYYPAFEDPVRPVNLVRFAFLNPEATAFYVDWEDMASIAVSILRTAAGRDPGDRDLSDLIGELSTRSEPFRERWAARDVRLHRTGTKQFRHPVVGEISLGYEAMELDGGQGDSLSAYTAEPGSPSDDALKLLASWAATVDASA
jgi:transcriptional regulator with XRE-family HTH domain